MGWVHHFEGDEVAVYLNRGWYEYAEQAFVWSYLRPGDTVIDCGAHFGLYSLIAARAMGNEGIVLALEPNPASAPILTRNVEELGATCVRLVEVAAASESGTSNLYVGEAAHAAYAGLNAEADDDTPVGVETITIDSLLEREGISHVDFLKIDVEGAELDVIAGARASVAHGALPLLMVEFSERNLQRSGKSTQALYDALIELGYTVCRFDDERRELVPCEVEGPVWYKNLFAARDVDSVNARVRSASEACRRIATGIITRGHDAQRLYEAAQRDRRSRRQLDEAVLHEHMLEQHLKTILTSKYVQTGWASGIVKKPIWVNDFLREVSAHEQALTEAERARSLIERARPKSELPVSVVIVTYNPRPKILEWAIDSIEQQTLPKDQFELLIVDNNSNPPLNLDELQRGRACRMRLVREARQGNVFSRCKGIEAARADLIVFVDDDNYLAPGYLEQSLRIMHEHPEIGVCAGSCDAVHERPVRLWKRCILPLVLPYLAVRNWGAEPITSNEDKWGPWEPPTSGMVLRRDVGLRFVEFVEHSDAAKQLGRKGRSMLACEDSLLARMAYRLGYYSSYQPSLHFHHYLPSSRLRFHYLVRLLHGLGRSAILLERTLGSQLDGNLRTVNSLSVSVALAKRFLGHILHHQIAAPIMFAWDFGFFTELYRQHRLMARER